MDRVRGESGWIMSDVQAVNQDSQSADTGGLESITVITVKMLVLFVEVNI